MDLLGEYSSSESDTEEQPHDGNLLKRKKHSHQSTTPDNNDNTNIKKQKSILPDDLLSLFDDSHNSNNNNITQDQKINKTKGKVEKELDKHNGRKRLFEHVEGNYPTYVYLRIPVTRKDIDGMINEMKELGTQLNINNHVDDYHISLSRVFPIREHHIDTLSNELKTLFKYNNKFSITFKKINTFINEDGSRIFLSAMVDKGEDTINSMIKQLDQCLLKFNFPTFHQNPLPHLSICWALTIDIVGNNTEQDKSKSRDDIKKEIDDKLNNHNVCTESIPIKTIYWKIGKFESSIDLI